MKGAPRRRAAPCSRKVDAARGGDSLATDAQVVGRGAKKEAWVQPLRSHAMCSATVQTGTREHAQRPNHSFHRTAFGGR